MRGNGEGKGKSNEKRQGKRKEKGKGQTGKERGERALKRVKFGAWREKKRNKSERKR